MFSCYLNIRNSQTKTFTATLINKIIIYFTFKFDRIVKRTKKCIGFEYGNEICRINGLVCVRERFWWLGAPPDVLQAVFVFENTAYAYGYAVLCCVVLSVVLRCGGVCCDMCCTVLCGVALRCVVLRVRLRVRIRDRVR